jgi:hypothetical protein
MLCAPRQYMMKRRVIQSSCASMATSDAMASASENSSRASILESRSINSSTDSCSISEGRSDSSAIRLLRRGPDLWIPDGLGRLLRRLPAAADPDRVCRRSLAKRGEDRGSELEGVTASEVGWCSIEATVVVASSPDRLAGQTGGLEPRIC